MIYFLSIHFWAETAWEFEKYQGQSSFKQRRYEHAMYKIFIMTEQLVILT